MQHFTALLTEFCLSEKGFFIAIRFRDKTDAASYE